MTYTIKTYQDGKLIGQCTAAHGTLTLAEREAVILAELSGETVEDVFTRQANPALNQCA